MRGRTVTPFGAYKAFTIKENPMSNPQDSLANHPQGSLADHPQNQLIVRIHDLDTVPEGHITFVVLLARYQGKWVYVRHKERTTWEIPGGHREPGEWLTDSAERELYEETGATVFTLDPLFDYEVDRSGEDLPTPMSLPYPVTYFQPPTRTFGRLYLAEIQELGALPEFEIAEVRLFENSPEHLTYPAIQPMLLKEGTKRLAMAPVPAKDKMLQLISPLLTAEPGSW
jgi:8-oxo-dGTP diphosphatase